MPISGVGLGCEWRKEGVSRADHCPAAAVLSRGEAISQAWTCGLLPRTLSAEF